ncbi:hypothetical protein CK203_011315 [Vitis vinifera]|uniref:Uncharacterized protein n=1 Tax=Vitis vinifera TaxID=29760 RepID=A0A438JZ82_VITVI|nr:hypothetical protein CK203_011315 [Vitis vinifera]
MCKALMPGDEESMSDEAIWETLPIERPQLQITGAWLADMVLMTIGKFLLPEGHFWVAISMVFFVAATLFTLLKLCGNLSLSLPITYFL